jgi:hypothetical protein
MRIMSQSMCMEEKSFRRKLRNTPRNLWRKLLTYQRSSNGSSGDHWNNEDSFIYLFTGRVSIQSSDSKRLSSQQYQSPKRHVWKARLWCLPDEWQVNCASNVRILKSMCLCSQPSRIIERPDAMGSFLDFVTTKTLLT